MAERGVVITGLGVVSAFGAGREVFWRSLLAGKSAIRPVKSFDASGFNSRLGAEVEGCGPRETYAYALAAAREALKDAGADKADPARCGVILGTTAGEFLSVERLIASAAGWQEVRAQAEAFSPGSIPARLARELGYRGPNLILTTACAAGNGALAAAFEKIRAGRADLILAGGVDVFLDVTYAGFSRLLAIAPEVCAPFSLGRRGMVPGEGCAVLVVEAEEAARARGASPYARLLGYGMSSDAKHVTAPDEAGVARAIAHCLSLSGLTPEDVDYVSAHGTGTPANDKAETAALKRVFGERAPSIPASSIKSMLGHAMGAASALEAAACCLALREGVLPPTINFTPGDPACDLDCVPGAARRACLDVVLSDAFAFGGSNCVIALGKPERARTGSPSSGAPIAVTAVAVVEPLDDPAAAAAAALPDKDTSYLDEPGAYALLGVSLLAAGGLAGLAGEELGVILDSSGELDAQCRFHEALSKEGPVGVEPRRFPGILANAAASRAAIAFGLRLVNESLGGAFPGGESALARAVELLRRDGRGVILAGGVGAGAAFMAVETLENARRRGAGVLALVEVEEEGFDPGGAREASGCFCLVEALKKVAAAGKALDYRACSRWGGFIRLRLTPPDMTPQDH